MAYSRDAFDRDQQETRERQKRNNRISQILLTVQLYSFLSHLLLMFTTLRGTVKKTSLKWLTVAMPLKRLLRDQREARERLEKGQRETRERETRERDQRERLEREIRERETREIDQRETLERDQRETRESQREIERRYVAIQTT